MGAFRQLKRHYRRHVLHQLEEHEYRANGLRVHRRNLAPLFDPAFRAAWQASVESCERLMGKPAPDTEWRAHICCWAARNALANPNGGDFVECGTWIGLLSRTVCEFTDFASTGRTFWLLDTYCGIPSDVSEEEKAISAVRNASMYVGDYYELARQNFASFANAHLIRGAVPGTLGQITSERIGYLSIDMNNANAETAAIEALWDRLVPGAIVILDDYGFHSHDAQQRAIDALIQSKGIMAALLPTGQGLIVKPGF